MAKSSIKISVCNRYTFITIIAFVTITILLLSGTTSEGEGGPIIADYLTQRVITTEEVVRGSYYGRGANCSWTPDSKLSFVGGGGDLVVFEVESGEKRIVIKAGQFVSRPWKVKFSNDGRFVLVGFEPRRLFRSSILARYAIYSGSTGEFLHHVTIGDNSVPQHPNHQPNQPEAFQLATFSNDNKTLLLVHKNDLYATKINAATPNQQQQPLRLTSDGSESIFNGIADWVYEEELFTSSSTSVFSNPSGSTITYIKFNDSTVEQITYNLYGDYAQEYFDEYYQYPKFGTVKYPKTGTLNPSVSIHTVRIGDEGCCGDGVVTNGNCVWEFKLSDVMGQITRLQYEPLLGSMKYISADVFSMLVFNRIQNMSWLIECNVSRRVCEEFSSTTQQHGWIDNQQVWRHGDGYIQLESVRESDGLEYGQIVQVGKDLKRTLTHGLFTVDEIIGVYDNEVIFKSGLLQNKSGSGMLVNTDSTTSHYYTLDLNTLSIKCISSYSDCDYSTAKFSGNGDYFVNTCEREKGVSRIEVVRATGKDNAVLKVLEENKAQEKKLSGVGLPDVEYFTIPYELGAVNYTFNCKAVGPRGWQDSGYKAYGVVVDVYGGPNSQKVTKRFSPNDWSYSLASNPSHPTVYITIDGVGSGRQSNSLAFEVYRDLGNKEVHDKIYAIFHILNKFKSLDPDRVLLWGWSYGGYLSGMLMGLDTKGVVPCGISVAPVVNWFYYDTIYTERYMSTPEDNPQGYNTSNILLHINNFKNKQYMLIHGNADDNVHYQQSMVLSRALEQANILFRMQSYPDENHSLGSVRPHLFKTLEDFVFNQCFSKRRNAAKI